MGILALPREARQSIIPMLKTSTILPSRADLKKLALKNAWRPVSEILALGDLWKACEIHVGVVG
jgi:hypothetical protein